MALPRPATNHVFRQNEGMVVVAGKCHWDGFLTVEITNRHYALEVIRQLAAALQDPGKEKFSLSFAGRLTTCEDSAPLTT